MKKGRKINVVPLLSWYKNSFKTPFYLVLLIFEYKFVMIIHILSFRPKLLTFHRPPFPSFSQVFIEMGSYCTGVHFDSYTITPLWFVRHDISYQNQSSENLLNLRIQQYFPNTLY